MRGAPPASRRRRPQRAHAQRQVASARRPSARRPAAGGARLSSAGQAAERLEQHAAARRGGRAGPAATCRRHGRPRRPRSSWRCSPRPRRRGSRRTCRSCRRCGDRAAPTGRRGEAFGQRRLGQDVADVPGGGLGPIRRTGSRPRPVAADHGRREAAAVGEPGIEAGHLERRDGGAAERYAKRRCRDRPAAGRAARRRCAGSRGSAAGPTFSSASTAGTFSDCCRARRTVTAPW